MTNPLENALQRGTFNVLDAVRGRGYPTDTVMVFAAEDAAFEAKKVQVQHATETDSKKLKVLEKRLGELIAEIKASALVFHMRGLSPAVVDTIREEGHARFGGDTPLEDGDESEFNMFSILAAAIEKVVDAEGNEDDHRWTIEELKELSGVLPTVEFGKIVETANNLIFGAAVFDEVVGPDFS